MTRQEVTFERDLQFSQWIKKNLPDSFDYVRHQPTGTGVYDIDWCIFNYKTKKIIFLEVKRFGSYMRPMQQKLYERLDQWIRKGIDQDWTYLGFHFIQFERSFFNDGGVKFDGKPITEDDLKKILSL